MKKLIGIILCIIMIFSIFSLTAAAAKVLLTNEAQIVTAVNAPSTDTYAAKVLQSYLQEITEITYPIVTDDAPAGVFEFAVGATNRLNYSFENKLDGSYAVKSYENGIAILGTGTRGTIYGVYGFLEKYCGCSWFTSELKVIPQNKNLYFDSEISYTYDGYFEYTDTDWISPCDPEYSLANGLSGGPYRDLTEEQGGTVDYISNFCHTLSTQYCSADKYFNEHPEYFALVDGQRVPQQLCLTNEDVYNIVLSEVMSTLKEKHNPNASLQIISLTQADNSDYCTCENCAAIDNANNSQAGTMITFVNRIANEVAAAGYSNVAIDTFAYRYTRHTPTAVKPESNVIVRLCTIECCFTHTLDDATCEENSGLMADLKGWGEICDRVYIWDYATNYAYTLGIFPDFNVIQRNMQVFYENGAKGIYEEGNYYMRSCNTEFGELRAYLLSKLMQNPYADYEALTDSFLQAYYGEGKDSIKSFINEFCTAAANNHVMIYSTMDKVKLSDEQIAAFDKYWETAKNAAGNETELNNTKRSEISWRYWKSCTNSGEFSGIKQFSARKALYDDIIALGTTRSSEGERIDFTKLNIASIVTNSNRWSSSDGGYTYILLLVAWMLYGVCLIGALILFINAIKNKHYINLVHLPLTAACYELIMWNRRSYLAWKDIDQFAITLVIFGLVFAFIMIAHSAAKNKLTAKKAIFSSVMGIVLFMVLYYTPLVVINIILYSGTKNQLTIAVAHLLVAIAGAAIILHTITRVRKSKHKEKQANELAAK